MDVRRTGGLGDVFRAFTDASRALTIGLLVTATVGGVALPAFILATGRLVDAVRTGASVAGPLTVVAAVFILERALDPVREELGRALWRRVDEHLTQRVMEAMAGPPGVAHVEDEGVANLIAEAQGALTDVTPGEAAVKFVSVWMQWTRGIAALLIVAGYRWWIALGLAVLYLAGYKVAQWHWSSVTVVMYGRTDRLRDAYYLRTVALTPEAAKETRVFGLAPWLVDDYRRRWLGVMVDVWRKRSEGWLAALAVGLLLAAAEAGALLILVNDAVAGALTVGAAAAVGQAVLAAAALTHYNDGHWALGECARALAGLQALEQAAGSAGATAGVVGGDRPADGLPRCEIRFEGVSFTYPGQSEPVFDNFDLTIEAGSSLAVVGQNGAGKTTLVKLLARLYEPTGGRITVDGIDLRDLDPTSWQRRVAAVFQDFVHFELSAYDNVAFGALEQYDDEPAVRAAARRAGAATAIERLDQDWTTMLSRQFSGGTQLSGGEWQRLALARALFAVEGGAGVLVLDEPTASLDVRGEADVYDRFLALTRGITTVIISHRFSTVRRADRIVVIEDGRIVEDGTHDQLLAAAGRYAHMYRLQASRFEDASHA